MNITLLPRLLSFFLIQLLIFSIFLPSTSRAQVPPDEPKIPGHISQERLQLIQNLILPEKRIPPPDVIYPMAQNDIVVQIVEQLNATILLKYLENLTAFGPRVTQTQACIDAGTYIYDQFKKMGLQVRYHNWSNEGYYGSNIEAQLSPHDPETDEIFLICGHYDSVSGSPGADDDGSGVAITLAAAEILSKYTVNKTVRFVAFSGEEQGLLGSERYAQEVAANNDNIIAVLNADMIGFALTYSDGQKIKIYADTPSLWITQYMTNISQTYHEYIDLTVLPSGTTSGSDHYYFWVYGYYAIFEHEYNFNDYYHSSQDTIQHMNLSYTVKTSRLLLATLAELLETDVVPPPLPVLEISNIQGGKGITAEITNIGLGTATNVTYTIEITGGLFISQRFETGTLGTLLATESNRLHFYFKGIGLGIFSLLPTITITATCDESVSTQSVVKAQVFFSQITLR
ncbi:MAG: M28 family peptidase [Candidatus Thermoplasmatota archaeon]